MNRNQKIGIGCGVAGCLGLVLLAVVVAVFVMGYVSMPFGTNRNANRNYNSNTNANRSMNSNSDTNSADETPSSSSMSDDDKHKLFQAASVTQDSELIQRVWRKLGLLNANGAPADEYTTFVKEHVVWLFKNSEFLQSVNTPEEGRAYVEAHIDD
jgi:hypothetical protein